MLMLDPDADPFYVENLERLEKLRRVSAGCELDIDRLSIKSGYFMYLYMTLMRRHSAPRFEGRSTFRERLQSLNPLAGGHILPAGKSGLLRVDYPPDLFPCSGGFYNKNMRFEATSVVMMIPRVPAFVALAHPRIDQTFSIRPLAMPKTVRQGMSIYNRLTAEGLNIPKAQFLKHHVLYVARLYGFAALFYRLLRQNEFTEVHLTRYSGVPMQGLLAAAKWVGLRTVEHQHGAMSPIHPAVKLIDTERFATVPDALRVSSTIYSKLPYGSAKIEVPDKSEADHVSPPSGRGILIAMHPRFSPKAVVLALRLAVDFPNAAITVRGHPRSAPTDNELKELCRHANIEYEPPSPIESSRSLCGRDGHITGSSTLGFTAAEAGIPSLFVHREGYDQATALLKEHAHLIHHAPSYEEIAKWIENRVLPTSRLPKNLS